MKEVSASLLPAAVAALVLFWFVGAHKRLGRLRTAALQAFVVLDARLGQLLDSAQQAASASAEAASPASDTLHAAAAQTRTVLDTTRQRPLDPRAMGALATAVHVLLHVWPHSGGGPEHTADSAAAAPFVHSLSAHGPSPAPASVLAVPHGLGEAVRIDAECRAFNAAVQQYNAAVAQFPASIVAWICRLRPAAPLR